MASLDHDFFPQLCLHTSDALCILVPQYRLRKIHVTVADSSRRTRCSLCQDLWDAVEGQAAIHLKYHVSDSF